MKITIISSVDRGGGGLAASRLHRGFVEAGENSLFYCRDAARTLPAAKLFSPPKGKIPAFWRMYRRWNKNRVQRHVRREFANLWGPDHLSRHGDTALSQIPQSDVWNLHSTFDLFDLQSFMRLIPRNTLLVYTLHQMNAFTGGCQYSQKCRGFEGKCEGCPFLYHDSAASHQVWLTKKAAYSQLPRKQMVLVSPSHWLAASASKSSLMEGFKIKVIPNGVDLTLFKPHDRALARAVLGVPPHAKVLLFVSQFDRKMPLKGFEYLQKSLSMLSGIPDLICLSMGPPTGDTKLSDVPLIETGAIEQQWILSLIYSAADLLVVPSMEDNFPNVILEASACGIPVVASNVGGIPEMIDHEVTGLLVPKAEPEAIAQGVEELLENGEARKRMGEAARVKCEKEFSIDIQCRKYLELFRSGLHDMQAGENIGISLG